MGQLKADGHQKRAVLRVDGFLMGIGGHFVGDLLRVCRGRRLRILQGGQRGDAAAGKSGCETERQDQGTILFHRELLSGNGHSMAGPCRQSVPPAAADSAG